MQNSVSSSQKQSKPINDIEIRSSQDLRPDRIPQKRFHKTTYNYIIVHQQAMEKEEEEEDEEDEDDDDDDDDEGEEKSEKTRWNKDKKILRLHNWKHRQTSVFLYSDLSHAQAIRFREQDYYKMKHLTIRFDGEESSGIRRLGIILSCLTQRQTEIQDLSLNIHNPENITEAGVNRIRRIILRNLPNLRSLKWEQFDIPSRDGRIITSQMIKRMTDLKSLFLNFGRIDLQDNETLPCIARNIATNVPNLEKLMLYFWASSVASNEEFNQFAQQLCRNLTRLKHLHLNFRSCQSLGPVSLKVLSKEICENLVNLRVLVLIFDGCPKIKKSDLDALTNELSKTLPNLKYLSYSDSQNPLNLLE